jgi:Tol biopolymer transport system component
MAGSDGGRAFRWLATTAAVVLVTASAGCGRSGSDAPEILFARQRGNVARFDVYVMKPNGSDLRLLLRDADAPAASPDGRTLAFARGGDIWTTDRKGSQPRRLTRGPGDDWTPAWARDGRTLYFARILRPELENGASAIFAVSADGTHVRRLAAGYCFSDPAASPDGHLVAYTAVGGDCAHGDQGEVDAVTAGGRPARLPFRLSPLWTYEPAWSPDGRRLAYTVVDVESDGGPYFGLEISRAQNSARPQRLVTRYGIGRAAWSPDGAQLAFDVDGDVWVIGEDGSKLHRLTRTSASERFPAWLPAAR